MWPTRELYTAGLFAFAFGVTGGIASHWFARHARWTSWLFCCTTVLGAVLEAAAAVGGLLLQGSEVACSFASGVPYLRYSIRLDPLGSFFLLTLSVLAAG